jgi:hypothetical protein
MGGALNGDQPKNLKLDIVVVRVNRTGEICNARPCYNCLNMMKSVGIRRVHYSVGPGVIVSENVKNMVSIQASAVTIHIEKINGNPLVNQIDKFYENLLTRFFPPIIRKDNLDKFITHNLSNVLPTHEVKIDNKLQSVIILDPNKKLIIKSKLLL